MVFWLSPQLLQLGTVRHQWQLGSTTAVSIECSSQTDHADKSVWTHHDHSKGNSLAVYKTPVQKFKLATLTFEILCDLSLSYWSDECQLVSDSSSWLRSSNTFTCVVPWTKTCLSGNGLFVCCCQSSGFTYLLSYLKSQLTTASA